MSIIDVADRAGVSKSTVSRVINDAPGVGPEMVAAVKRAMDEIGYRPARRRRGPKPRSPHGGRTGNLALVVMGPNATADLYRLPVLPAMLHGIERQALDEGLNLLLTRLTPDGPPPAVLTHRQADGLLLMGSWDALPEALRNTLRTMPAVWIFRENSDERSEFDHVFYNNRVVGEVAAKHLLQRGRRSVGYISFDPLHTAFGERQRVFEATIRAAGGTVHSVTSGVKHQTPPAAACREMLEKLLHRPDPVNGLFVPTDIYLPCIYQALAELGIRPQRDLDLVSCDNQRQILNHLDPAPPSIDINLEMVGRRGVQQLLWRMRAPEHDNHVTTLVEPRLVMPAMPDAAASEPNGNGRACP